MFNLLYNLFMEIKSAEFIKSAAKKEQFLEEGISEFAFVGRSNCGKSSLINMLCLRKKLAKTSQTPGHTKLVNYFLINKGEKKQFVLVDLPGYGFSLAGKITTEGWGKIVEEYLKESKNLRRVFVLIDCRLKPSVQDVELITYLYFNRIAFTVVLTKTDKISKLQLSKNLPVITSTLKLGKQNLIYSSSKTRGGRKEILEIIENVF